MSRYGRFEGVDEAVELNVVAARQDCNGPSPTNQEINRWMPKGSILIQREEV
jgi:hypothetical protein